jgi:hypothetical protein
MKAKNLLLGLMVFLLIVNKVNAQKEVLTNKNIQEMVKAGLDNDIIINKINSSTCKFDLSTNALISLKNEKVSSQVIQAMLNKKETIQTNDKPIKTNIETESTTKNISNPKLPALSPGIYYEDESNNLKILESSTFTQSKSGSGFLTGLTYGAAKTKMKSVLSGIHANTEIKKPSPVFFFVFPKATPNDNNFSVNAADGKITSPKEFALIKFIVVNTNKSKGREVVTGSWNYGGTTGGFEDENIIPFKFDKVAENIYKIYFEKQPEIGEYAFIHAGGTASYGAAGINRAFDFSIIK